MKPVHLTQQARDRMADSERGVATEDESRWTVTQIKYDPEADAGYVRLSDAPIARTVEESDVCILDYDDRGTLVGIELLSVFGFAGASLQALVARNLLSQGQADAILRELRVELVAA